MMFLIGGKQRCARRNPRVGAMLGLLSALMLGGAGYLQRYEGEHEWRILAAMLCFMLIGLGLIRFDARNQDDRK